jgi:hypothetical protein
MAQIAWVLDYLPDLESDMSAFHRVDDIWSMPGARFFRLAWRLPAYEGVMRARVMTERETGTVVAEQRPASATQEQPPAPPRRPREPVAEAAVSGDPALGRVFSFSTFTRSGASDTRPGLRETALREQPEPR